MNELTVTVIDSNEEWQKLAPQWSALLEASASGSVFLTWEWLSAWAEFCIDQSRRLFILAFREKGELVGIAPFYVERKKHGLFPLREIRFLGGPEAGSDYLDVFARRGREREVTAALYDFLMGKGASAWDQLVLSDMPADSLFLLHFMNRVEAEGKYAEINRGSYCPVASFAGTETEFFTALSKDRIKRFRYDERVIRRGQEVVHSVHKGEEVVGRLGEFFRLYEEKAGWSGKKLQPFLQGFLGRCNGVSPAQIDLLSVNGQAVAGLLHLRYRNTLALYLMAVDKKFNPKISLGNLLVGLCIRNSIAAGYSTYDFLKGDESYKFNWANGGKSTIQITFWQKRPAAVTSAVVRLARHAGKLLLR